MNDVKQTEKKNSNQSKFGFNLYMQKNKKQIRKEEV